jgi:hypothetical protein
VAEKSEHELRRNRRAWLAVGSLALACAGIAAWQALTQRFSDDAAGWARLSLASLGIFLIASAGGYSLMRAWFAHRGLRNLLDGKVDALLDRLEDLLEPGHGQDDNKDQA